VATTEVSGIVARLLERKADIRRILTASAPVRTRRTETTILALISGGNRGLLSPENPPGDYPQAPLCRPREPLINLRIMAHCAFDSRGTAWAGS
jgi:hypothetical protein